MFWLKLAGILVGWLAVAVLFAWVRALWIKRRERAKRAAN